MVMANLIKIPYAILKMVLGNKFTIWRSAFESRYGLKIFINDNRVSSDLPESSQRLVQRSKTYIRKMIFLAIFKRVYLYLVAKNNFCGIIGGYILTIVWSKR